MDAHAVLGTHEVGVPIAVDELRSVRAVIIDLGIPADLIEADAVSVDDTDYYRQLGGRQR